MLTFGPWDADCPHGFGRMQSVQRANQRINGHLPPLRSDSRGQRLRWLVLGRRHPVCCRRGNLPVRRGETPGLVGWRLSSVPTVRWSDRPGGPAWVCGCSVLTATRDARREARLRWGGGTARRARNGSTNPDTGTPRRSTVRSTNSVGILTMAAWAALLVPAIATAMTAQCGSSKVSLTLWATTLSFGEPGGASLDLQHPHTTAPIWAPRLATHPAGYGRG